MDDFPIAPNEPGCTLCAFGDAVHVHRYGRVPQLPCPQCLAGDHGGCDPFTYWCGCHRLDCIGAQP